MDIEYQIGQLEQSMHTLLYADEVPNTFGMTGQVAAALQSISMAMANKELGKATKERLDAALTTVEDNRSVFAIPETFLIDRVFQLAKAVRAKLGRGPFMG